MPISFDDLPDAGGSPSASSSSLTFDDLPDAAPDKAAQENQYETQTKEANQKQSFLENLGEGAENAAVPLVKSVMSPSLENIEGVGEGLKNTALGRGAENAVTGLMQIAGIGNQEDLANITKENRIQSAGTGVSGAVGETVLNPKYAALLAAGPMGWVGRAAVGAGIGGTDPVETTNTKDAWLQRGKNAAGAAGAFAVVPAVANKALDAISPILADQTSGAISKSVPEKAYKNVAETALKTKTPQEILSAAQDIKNTPQDKVSLTLPESLENPTLLGKQRVLGERTNEAGEDFSKFNRSRLGDTLTNAKEGLVSDIAGGTPDTLTEAGGGLRESAQKVIDDAIDKRKAATKPVYESIKLDQVPEDVSLALRANPAIEDAYQKVLKNDSLMERQHQFTQEIPPQYKEVLDKLSPEARKQAIQQLGIKPVATKQTTGGLPEDSLGVWHKVKQELDSNYETNEFGKATPNGRLQRIAATDVNKALADVNSKYATANEDFASQSDEIKQLMSSPIGKLARVKDDESAAKLFMNMSREQLQQATKMLPPDTVQGAAGAMMKELVDKSSNKGLQGFINTLESNDIAKDRMQAILGPQGYSAQQELIQTLKKVIPGLPRNSETATKLETGRMIEEEAGGKFPNLPTSKLQAMKGAYKWLGGLKGAAQSKISAQYQKDLMNVFLNPDLDKLGAALENANKAERNNLILQYIGESVGGEPKPDKSQPKKQESPKTIPAKPPEKKAENVIDKFAKAESSNNPNAKNPNSSASGLLQFTNGTWAAMVRRYGQKTGLTMADKNKPDAQKRMGALLARDNAQSLVKSLGRAPTTGELYMAHFLGADGAKKLIGAQGTKQPAARLFSAGVVSPNRDIFFNGRSPRSVEQVYALLDNKVSPRGYKDGGKVEPSPAQKEAGNYKKDHLTLHGLNIAIENRKGSERNGVEKDTGKTWSVKMPNHYGYIKRTEGADGDHVDCYVGDDPESKKVFIIDQLDHKTEKFDEHKVMLGYPTKFAAVSAYRKAFSDKKDRLGKITETSIDGLKEWLKEHDTTKPAHKIFKQVA